MKLGFLHLGMSNMKWMLLDSPSFLHLALVSSSHCILSITLYLNHFTDTRTIGQKLKLYSVMKNY